MPVEQVYLALVPKPGESPIAVHEAGLVGVAAMVESVRSASGGRFVFGFRCDEQDVTSARAELANVVREELGTQRARALEIHEPS